MRVLKNVNSDRFFLATPKLLKHQNIIDATPQEAEAYLTELESRGFNRSKIKTTSSLKVPDKLDLTIDVTTFGKPELIAVAKKIELQYPNNVRVGQLRKMVQDALWTLREEQGQTVEAD